MHLKITTFIILTTMILNTGYGQNFDGKWFLKQMGTGKMKKTPVQYKLDIENENAILFLDFVPSGNQLELKIKNGTFTYQNEKKYADSKLRNENNLTLLVEGMVNDKKGIIEMDFVKLFPTVTNLSIEQIEAFTYEIRKNEKTKSKFEFNKEMMDLKTIEQLGHKEGQKMRIEKIDSTLFVSIYVFGSKSACLPIKEVSSDFIKIYGIPGETDELIATRTE